MNTSSVQCSVTDEPVIDLGGGGRLDHLTKQVNRGTNTPGGQY